MYIKLLFDFMVPRILSQPQLKSIHQFYNRIYSPFRTMVLKLHGSPLSTCTARVRLALVEKGVDAEFHIIDLTKGEHVSPSYLEKQPFGKVPFFEDTETGVQVFGSFPLKKLINSC